ncbi:hypothetical protein GCM10009819_23380 [Agromyces tropicus]|uniref:FHA domain-containing protein n=1 Tax=Agromyces tropicus TaxID=555371 RepID=A0ABP5G0M2_9MICO
MSRHHARLVRAGDTVTIEDAGSTNGTEVNGRHPAGPHELHHGDLVRLGPLELSYLGPRERPLPRTTHRRGRVRIWRAVLVGGLANLLLLAVGVVVQFATDWTGIGPWLAAPLTGMAAALVQILKDALTKVPEPAPPGEAAPGGGGPPAPRVEPVGAHTTAPMGFEVRHRRGGLPVVVAAIVTVLVLGVGGVAVAYGVATVSGWITGNQVGVDRLVGGPVAVDSGGIVTTVTAVEHTADFTRVELSVRNDLANTVTLPVYRNASLSAADGTTLDADAFRSSWGETLAPGQLRSGVIVFGGHLPDAGTTATLTFATVFEQGFSGPSSIAVGGLGIAPLGP